MIILNKDRREIINIDNLVMITIINEYGTNEEIDKIKYSSIIGKIDNKGVCLGIYETEERAKQILLDIYSKISENKSSYKMPEE